MGVFGFLKLLASPASNLRAIGAKNMPAMLKLSSTRARGIFSKTDVSLMVGHRRDSYRKRQTRGCFLISCDFISFSIFPLINAL